MVILKDGKKSQLLMMFLETKKRENSMIEVVNKLFNKDELEVVVVVTSFRKCLAEVEVEEQEDLKKERVFNTQSKLLSKKSSKVKHLKLLSIEIGSANLAWAREVKMALKPLAQLVEEEVRSPKWFNLAQECILKQQEFVRIAVALVNISETKINAKNAMVKKSIKKRKLLSV